MATLVLTAAGTAIAGPIGASIGSLIGSQIDARLFSPPNREGPRLQELKVTTSSYGTPIPRHFGTMRAAGTVVWATDLVESSETSGGKGQPSVTTYSYSASFAVALASRPIANIGRIWADGNLLRGAAGDLKVGGELRIYTGDGDQAPDSLIVSAEGSACPAFRGLAYCVFEELQLADFGNRIPSLTFEIIADDGSVSLTEMLSPLADNVSVDRPLPSLKGYSDEGGSILDVLTSIDRVYPLASNAHNGTLAFTSGDPTGDSQATLPEPVIDPIGKGFGGAEGRAERMRADTVRIPAGLRYYDIDRDFQAGMQRASGRAMPGSNRVIEFPGALHAVTARKLADEAGERARWGQDRLAYRIAEIDPSLTPGAIVTVPGKGGKWRIDAWEWRENGIELELLRLPYRKGAEAATDAGRSLPHRDALATPTLLEAFALPWDGTGASDKPQVFAAASSISNGWRGAALYAQAGSSLTPIGSTGSRRCAIGTLESAIARAQCALVDRHTRITIALAADDFFLDSCTLGDLASGVNRALLGTEIIQFANATSLGSRRWQLSTLLRGRGGTEHAAHAGHSSGTSFILLDDKPALLDSASLDRATAIAAIGLADPAPVVDLIGDPGSTLRPLSPVHPQAWFNADGSLAIGWTRRARGAWLWSGAVDAPLVEESEQYEVGVGDPASPLITWQVTTPNLAIDAASVAQLHTDHPGAAIWVRQIGTHARSHPLLLTTLT